jgi:UDP-N-acetylglucosamine 2-epimerase (non-hydrolysing)
VIAALRTCGLPPDVILTGQHADLDPLHYRLHGKVLRLDCAGGTDPREHAQRVARALAGRIGDADLIIVQGDTSSALGGALAGFAGGVPVAHVEAGLRSFDPAMPWPEEDNRIAIDAKAELLFAATDVSADNLRIERVPGEIHVTGTSGIDALLPVIASLPPQVQRSAGQPLCLLVTCHRRENWGAGLTGVAMALLELTRTEQVVIDFVLHPNPRVADAMKLLLGDQPRIRLIPPLEHRAMILAMRDTDLILSDSGGVQEEAPALGTPLLVLREKTERPEGIASGNMRLVGTDQRKIVREVRRILYDPVHRASMSRPALPYGDGRTGERVAAIVTQWLATREPKRLRA